MIILRLICFWIVITECISKDAERLRLGLARFFDESELMGLTVEVAENSSTIFKLNQGFRDYQRRLPINNETIFRMASLSKSPTSVGLLQQFQKLKLSFTDSISDLIGFAIVNPFFPDCPMTLQMLLTHQSSLQQCDSYYSFLHDTYTGPPFPKLSELLTPSGKYYDLCLFNPTHAPGTFYEYVNYNYAIAATILERVANQRFDLYLASNLFEKVGMNRTSYRREALKGQVQDIAVLYRADTNGTWVPQADNWKGEMPQRNFTSYVIGANGAVFSPMGGLYSTTRDLTEYINIIRQQGLATNGYRVLAKQSADNMVRTRYRYHGSNKALNSSQNSYNAYGFGIQTSTYDPYDRIFPNKVVRGHWGDSYGLISEYQYTENYSYVYVINGAKKGYHPSQGSFYESERQTLHKLLYEYLYL